MAELAGSAWAAFPYEYDGTAPSDLEGKVEWMYAATPEQGNALVNADPRELGGVRGASLVDDDPSVATAWQTTTGRPTWRSPCSTPGSSGTTWARWRTCARKTRLNKGELAATLNHPQRGPTPWAGGGLLGLRRRLGRQRRRRLQRARLRLRRARATRRPRSATGRSRRGRPVLDPQDVLIAFTDGADDDGNGFADDIVGWDFLDDDNDPFDDVQYGHGTGEARDSTAEADNGGELGTCPNCMSMPLRVGDSFIADESDFAQAVALRGRQRRAGGAGGARHAQPHAASRARPSSTPTATTWP